MVKKEKIEMVKFVCPNCKDVFKIAALDQWVCNNCHARLLIGMKRWKVAPTQKVAKVKAKRGRGRPRKETA